MRTNLVNHWVVIIVGVALWLGGGDAARGQEAFPLAQTVAQTRRNLAQTNLLDSVALALDSALQQLADARPNDNHGDFFTFPALLAYENLHRALAATGGPAADRPMD